QKIVIVAHSLGALIGTWICQLLADRIQYFFNIEGNLTLADGYFSSKPLGFDTAEAFANAFRKDIAEKADTAEIYHRYFSSLKVASPEGMRNWSFSSQKFIRDNQCGLEFAALHCHKLYIWGDVDTPLETQSFIKAHQIPNKLYSGIGHWHMIENNHELYGDIYQMLH
ncbi:MAG: alpha/beta hydrolase, partial [Bacteroidota bacterium]